MSQPPTSVYVFGEGHADGGAAHTPLLGGKGANLAEMTRLGLPVPPGFTISTEACRAFWAADNLLPEAIRAHIVSAFSQLETRTGLSLGDSALPLLVSVRSGAAVSMPGMMDTVLNLGLNDRTVEGLAKRTQNRRFAYDSYRRLLQMYAHVVMGMNPEILEQFLERMKDAEGVRSDARLTVDALERLVSIFKMKIFESTGREFPQDPADQVWAAIDAVFRSWNTRRALDYRNAKQIPHDLGTAVSVQAMVFGNMGETSATGVAFTRDPNSGAPHFFGEWLPNAQGEDVVAGLRTPRALNLESGAFEIQETLGHQLPDAYAELERIRGLLENHYRDMQDIEFTIEQGKLWMLQTRTGKRSAEAAVRIAVDMVEEGLIGKDEAILRVSPESLEKLLHPRLDPTAERHIIVRGLGASPGAATGRVFFNPADAVLAAGRGEAVILVRPETSPEDVHGMLSADGILTARGGMTSHAAVVARGMGKPCIVGCRDLRVDIDGRVAMAWGHTIKEGDVVTIDGTDGSVMLGSVDTIQAETSAELDTLMSWVDSYRVLNVRANADTPKDARAAKLFGAEGIGLCRTEHMFFDTDRIVPFREMILATDEAGRRGALERILPMQRGDFESIFRIMDGLPVTIRLLDPPLHEFLPHTDSEIEAVAIQMGISAQRMAQRVEELREVNPMLGHRGCRVGLTMPELYEVQVQAILEAACKVASEGVVVIPEIMIPLVGIVRELELLRDLVRRIADTVICAHGGEGSPMTYSIGTMVELPRTCLVAGEIAESADFFSFGTNDLTQTTFGLSRDDCGRFLPLYVEMGILPGDPFVSLDPAVCALIQMATEKGRQVKPELKVGICGEHGGEARSVHFCHAIGLDYVSCSPSRVPIARLAAAQAALKAKAQ